MKNLIIIIQIVIFYTYSNYTLANDKKNRPEWIEDPSIFCHSTKELCTVGEGPGAMTAEAMARKSLAQIFATQVKSKSKVNTSSRSESDADGLISGKVYDSAELEVSEMTDEVLKGVEIRKKYLGKDAVFALAVLNKAKAADSIEEEVTVLDEKMVSYYKENKRTFFNKMLKLYAVREKLMQRFLILTDRTIANKITYQQIVNQKNTFFKNRVSVYLGTSFLKQTKELKPIIIKALTDNSYKVLVKDSRKIKYKIKGNVTAKKEYLNVEGFEKYNFLINLYAENKDGVKLGTMVFSSIKVGRSFKQAFELAKEEINDYINNHVEDLSIN